MLHACVQRFDVMENLEKFCKILEIKQALPFQSKLMALCQVFSDQLEAFGRVILYRHICFCFVRKGCPVF